MLASSRPPFSLPRSLSVATSPPSLPLLRPKRPQESVLLRVDVSKSQTLRLHRRWSLVFGLKGKDEFEDLEAEVFEFMEASANPGFFPSRQELIAAGRGDLAEAIASRGGWLAYGWDCQEEGEKEREEEEEEEEEHRRGLESGWESANEPLCFALASSSGRWIEMENEADAGIEGILSRLEKERNLAFGLGPRENETNGSVPWGSGEHHQGHAAASNGGGRLEQSNYHQSSNSNFGDFHPQSQLPAETTERKHSTPDEWTTWNLKRISSLSEFEAAEIVSDAGKTVNNSFASDGFINGKAANSLEESGSGRNEPKSDGNGRHQNLIRMRLHQLESELTSALHLLRSGNGGEYSSQEDSLEDMHKLSDAWEFQETEIMNARNKLRSIRAKIAVLEGKMALEIIETQKIKEDKQRRLDAAKRSIQLLRTTCIIWANSASEVFLAGSFDGWTGKRKMEKSTAGMFFLYLKLYPGRYEIKFIVDGAWQVDPLRPIVNNNGHENNLLVVT
ncbi:putative AMP-activated kinase, glycogen-binding protein [Dioscorea sansibarensis]